MPNLTEQSQTQGVQSLSREPQTKQLHELSEQPKQKEHLVFRQRIVDLLNYDDPAIYSDPDERERLDPKLNLPSVIYRPMINKTGDSEASKSGYRVKNWVEYHRRMDGRELSVKEIAQIKKDAQAVREFFEAIQNEKKPGPISEFDLLLMAYMFVDVSRKKLSGSRFMLNKGHENLMDAYLDFLLDYAPDTFYRFPDSLPSLTAKNNNYYLNAYNAISRTALGHGPYSEDQAIPEQARNAFVERWKLKMQSSPQLTRDYLINHGPTQIYYVIPTNPKDPIKPEVSYVFKSRLDEGWFNKEGMRRAYNESFDETNNLRFQVRHLLRMVLGHYLSQTLGLDRTIQDLAEAAHLQDRGYSWPIYETPPAVSNGNELDFDEDSEIESQSEDDTEETDSESSENETEVDESSDEDVEDLAVQLVLSPAKILIPASRTPTTARKNDVDARRAAFANQGLQSKSEGSLVIPTKRKGSPEPVAEAVTMQKRAIPVPNLPVATIRPFGDEHTSDGTKSPRTPKTPPSALRKNQETSDTTTPTTPRNTGFDNVYERALAGGGDVTHQLDRVDLKTKLGLVGPLGDSPVGNISRHLEPIDTSPVGDLSAPFSDTHPVEGGIFAAADRQRANSAKRSASAKAGRPPDSPTSQSLSRLDFSKLGS